jgi:hypothetical protein
LNCGLLKNNIIEKPSPIFRNKKLHRHRIADGVKGNHLVDGKVRRPGVKPSSSDIAQMQDYKTIIQSGLKSIDVDGLALKGPYIGVYYMFNDKSVIPLWRDALINNLGGLYKTI